jgi:hypothetical protein
MTKQFDRRQDQVPSPQPVRHWLWSMPSISTDSEILARVGFERVCASMVRSAFKANNGCNSGNICVALRAAETWAQSGVKSRPFSEQDCCQLTNCGQEPNAREAWLDSLFTPSRITIWRSDAGRRFSSSLKTSLQRLRKQPDFTAGV